ncbi:pilus assembly protein TadG-related protein [Paludisphaera soli]|uniref:pilus assembly protein TadG-related protein n=1 Tax=Paludisphaera soli TaxID=2712865 RepID=UPI0013EC91D8|nr:pilus assembly protein TadG-related protein [Paludisphaera soli]
MTRDRTDARRGAVAVVAAVSMIPLVGVLALVLDAGLLMAERRRAQSAADAASFAAVCAYKSAIDADDGQSSQAAATAAAQDYAAANGYSSGANVTVTVRSPVAPSRYAGKAGAFQVLIVSSQPRLFSAIWGSDDIDVAASSVSYAKPTAPPSIIVLNPNAQGSLTTDGGASLTTAGEIHVKSNHALAGSLTNNSYVKATGLQIAGGYHHAGATLDVDPAAIRTGADPTTLKDPWKDLPLPSSAGLTPRPPPAVDRPEKTVTLDPGLYTSGLKMTTGQGGVVYTMNPGLYFVRGGDLQVGNNVHLTGKGVVIFVEDGNVKIEGGDGVNLQPPTSGTYKDVSIFQRADKNPITEMYTPRVLNVANGTDNVIGGVIYAPGAAASFAGGSNNTSAAGKQLIVNTLNLSNNAVLNLPGWPEGASVSCYLVE